MNTKFSKLSPHTEFDITKCVYFITLVKTDNVVKISINYCVFGIIIVDYLFHVGL